MPLKDPGLAPDLCRPKPEFLTLSEPDIWKSLESGQINPVLTEVTRLVAGYLAIFRASAEKGGALPLFEARARSPIEKVAILMAAAYAAHQPARSEKDTVN
jgi:hypothetical protein